MKDDMYFSNFIKNHENLLKSAKELGDDALIEFVYKMAFSDGVISTLTNQLMNQEDKIC